ncbi:MAG TPA: hypothetical protein VHH36_05125 [Candidatus Thermoplasmatota archaeon]|nr:hypothetical protein [Candidatus Thermoplasmatota archaeon]
MSAARAMAQLLALVLIAVVLSRLPAQAFASAQATLVVASGVLLLALAAAVLLAPVRRVLARAFLTPPPREAGAFALPQGDEARGLVRPALAALACLAAAGMAALLR